MEAFLLVSGGIWSALNRACLVPDGSFLLTFFSEFKHFFFICLTAETPTEAAVGRGQEDS